MGRRGEDIKVLHVDLPIALHTELETLKGARSWKAWLAEIRDDFRKAHEKIRFLKNQVSFYTGENEELKARLARLQEVGTGDK